MYGMQLHPAEVEISFQILLETKFCSDIWQLSLIDTNFSEPNL